MEAYTVNGISIIGIPINLASGRNEMRGVKPWREVHSGETGKYMDDTRGYLRVFTK